MKDMRVRNTGSQGSAYYLGRPRALYINAFAPKASVPKASLTVLYVAQDTKTSPALLAA